MHSPTLANGCNNHNNTNGSGGSNQVLYKDERTQQMHKKLQKKLEKRGELSSGANGGSAPSPRKNNGNGEVIMHSIIPVNMVVGNKRTNCSSNSSNNNNNNNGGHKAHLQQVNYHPQFHNPPHLNNSHNSRIVLTAHPNSHSSATAGPRKVAVLKGKHKRVSNGGGSGGGNANNNGNGATSEEGEEGMSSVAEDEEEGGYQVLGDAEDEVDGEANGGAGVVVTTGDLSSAEEAVQHIKERLSLVAGPKVSEILSRSALLQWVPPPNSDTVQFDVQSLFYEILLSDSAKAAKYKSIFKGQSLSCRIEDLKPGVEYSVCLRVHYDNVQGLESPTTIFNTVPCAPDAPLPPKLLTRSKNQLQLRWNGTNDNGSHIQQYVLEFDGGRGMDFVEVCKTKGKQYTLNKLIPSTTYR